MEVHLQHKVLSSEFRVPQNTFNTLVDECERSSLLSISPHLKFVSGSEGFSTKSCWCFLASAYSLEKMLITSRKRNNDNVTICNLLQPDYLSMFQMGHKCYGNVQCDIQFRSPCCNAYTTPQLQAFLSHKHLEAKTRIKTVIIAADYLIPNTAKAY